MKWLAVIIILVIVVGAIWLLSQRRGTEDTTTPAHRLDDSITPPATTAMTGDPPVATEAATLAGAEGPEGHREPDSDYRHDRDFVDDTRPTPGADPEDTDGRTTT